MHADPACSAALWISWRIDKDHLMVMAFVCPSPAKELIIILGDRYDHVLRRHRRGRLLLLRLSFNGQYMGLDHIQSRLNVGALLDWFELLRDFKGTSRDRVLSPLSSLSLNFEDKVKRMLSNGDLSR